MHDSRGASLKVGDRVLIEAEIIELNSGGDENFCCVGVKVVTPDQPKRELVMQAPTFSALSTKMLTKIGALLLLLIFTVPADAQLFRRVFRGPGGCENGQCAVPQMVQSTRTVSTVSTGAVYLPATTARVMVASTLYLPAIPEQTSAAVVILRSPPVEKVVSAPSALRFHAGHNCPSCGAYRNVVTGSGPGGTHTHTCPRCNLSWYH